MWRKWQLTGRLYLHVLSSHQVQESSGSSFGLLAAGRPVFQEIARTGRGEICSRKLFVKTLEKNFLVKKGIKSTGEPGRARKRKREGV